MLPKPGVNSFSRHPMGNFIGVLVCFIDSEFLGSVDSGVSRACFRFHYPDQSGSCLHRRGPGVGGADAPLLAAEQVGVFLDVGGHGLGGDVVGDLIGMVVCRVDPQLGSAVAGKGIAQVQDVDVDGGG